MQDSTHTSSGAVHPVLIILPLCLLGISVLFDSAATLSGAPVWGILSYGNLVTGILVALVSTGIQLAQSRIHSYGTRFYRVIFMNHLLNLTALLLFGLSLVYRIHDPSQPPDNTAYFASVFGLFVLAIGGWLAVLRSS